jgi:hypothetical protein
MLQGYEIRFNIYAESEQEATVARNAIVEFINDHARHGRAVTGRKIAEAVSRWDKNPFIKSKIIEFFK